MQFYDYDAAVQHLRTLGVDRVSNNDTEPRKAVFQQLGFICHSFSTANSYQVMQELLTFGRRNPIVDTANSNRGGLSSTSTRFGDDHQVSRHKSHSDEILPLYTSILYKEGARRNVVIRRTFSVLSLEPPQMKATVSFGALGATSIGRTRKIAGHMAAKEICDKLNFMNQSSWWIWSGLAFQKVLPFIRVDKSKKKYVRVFVRNDYDIFSSWLGFQQLILWFHVFVVRFLIY